MASITAAVCAAAPAALCGAASASTSTSNARSQLAAPGLKSSMFQSAAVKPLEWSSKTVSNGSRVNAFNVVDPYHNLKFETLSFLPQLTDEQIVKQVDYIIRNGWIPAIEFDKHATLSRIECKVPTYCEGRYWTMWKLPLFGATDATQVLNEVRECDKKFPGGYIRVIGFDKVRQVQVIGFIVVKPKTPK